MGFHRLLILFAENADISVFNNSVIDLRNGFDKVDCLLL